MYWVAACQHQLAVPESQEFPSQSMTGMFVAQDILGVAVRFHFEFFDSIVPGRPD